MLFSPRKGLPFPQLDSVLHFEADHLNALKE